MTAQPDVSTAQFSFTKVIVDDLERCSAFYQQVFGLTESARVDDEIAGRSISEIMFNPTADGAGTFVLLRYNDRDQPAAGELITGFITGDLEALVARAIEAGGTVADDIRKMPEHGVEVAFLNDIEGHLLEVVELLS
jgi:lactoylglutathione lyase